MNPSKNIQFPMSKDRRGIPVSNVQWSTARKKEALRIKELDNTRLEGLHLDIGHSLGGDRWLF
jgi:hypothetical protein